MKQFLLKFFSNLTFQFVALSCLIMYALYLATVSRERELPESSLAVISLVVSGVLMMLRDILPNTNKRKKDNDEDDDDNDDKFKQINL